jgi:hypothetical protein
MQLSALTLTALAVLAGWFGLDFVGVAGIVDREPVFSLAGLMLGVLSVFALLALGQVRFAAPFYAVALLIWAALQVETHWSTYLLFDAGERKLAWYQSVFGPHWRFLPEVASRTTPDGYHTVLAGLIVVNLLLALRDVVRR